MICLIISRTFQCGPAVAGEPEVALLEQEVDLEARSCDVEQHLALQNFRFPLKRNQYFERLSVSVKMPSGKKDVAHIKVNFVNLIL